MTALSYRTIQFVFSLLFLFCTIIVLSSCADDSEDSSSHKPLQQIDDSPTDDDDALDDDDDIGPVKVVMDYVLVDGAQAPPNPVTGEPCPEKYNKVPVTRWRMDNGIEEPAPVRAVIILIPGVLAGSTDFYFMGQDLVEISNGEVEVWAIDRRTNLLEDQTGFDAAESAGDPWIARDYYFRGVPVDGRTYQGVIDGYGPDTDYMSEWGVDLFMNDLLAVVKMVPEQSRTTNVFVGGHSRGVGYAQMFAAYQFDDGTIGADHIAGVCLLDGARRWDDQITEDEYLEQVESLRDGTANRHNNENDSSLSLVYWTEYLAMAATRGMGAPDDEQMGADGILKNKGPMIIVELLAVAFQDIKMTNEALFGWLLDDQSGLPGSYYARMGRLGGGELGWGVLGQYPTEKGKTYYWENFDKTDPKEQTDVQRLIRMLYTGPSDFIEMYFSSRYELDDWTSGALETEGTWVHDYLRFYTSRVDVPIYALSGNIMNVWPTYFTDYREMLPPVAGYSRPRSQFGFHIHYEPTWGHIDTVLTNPDRNTFYIDFLRWINDWSVGYVSVPGF